MSFALRLRLGGILPLSCGPGGVFCQGAGNGCRFTLVSVGHLGLNGMPNVEVSVGTFDRLNVPTSSFVGVVPLCTRREKFSVRRYVFFALFDELG